MGALETSVEPTIARWHGIEVPNEPVKRLAAGLADTIGLQVPGRRFGEGRILKVAGAPQSDTNWHRARPPILEQAA